MDAGHLLLLSVVGVTRRGCGQSSSRDRFRFVSAGSGTEPLGRICEDLCKQRTLSKLLEATVEINACQLFRIQYTHSYDSPIVNFI